MGTVEAIQCMLTGVGVILLPGTPEDVPEFIKEQTVYEMPRIFPHANPHGPVFHYTYEPMFKQWKFNYREEPQR